MTEQAYAEQIEELLQRADASYHAGDLQEARQIWEAVLQIDPECAAALEGLRLAALMGGHWSLLDDDPEAASAAERARVREALDAGVPEEAWRLLAPLVARGPVDDDLAALRRRVDEARARAPLVANAMALARSAAAHGDAGRVAAAARQALELDPGNREAELLLEQFEQTVAEPAAPAAPAAAAPAPPSGALDLELELDLALAPVAARPAPRAAAAPTAHSTLECDVRAFSAPAPAARVAPVADAPSVRDLLEAAEDLGVEPEVSDIGFGHEPQLDAAAPRPDEGQAALLVAQARARLEAGDCAAAAELAGRALVLFESAPGAQDVLDDVRAQEQRRASESDRLLADAIEAFDTGEVERSIPMFEEVLQLVPGHAEAHHYLERARGELARHVPAAAPPPRPAAVPLMDVDLPPLLPEHDAPIPLSAAAPPPLPVSAVAAAGVALDVEPAVASIPLVRAATQAPGEAAPPPPLPYPAASGPMRPRPATTPRAATPGLPRRTLVLGAAALLLLALLGAGGWWAMRMLGGPARSSAATAAAPKPGAAKPVALTARDVPRLVAAAQGWIAAGKLDEARTTLVAAQKLSPNDVDVLEMLDRLRGAERHAAGATGKFAQARKLFREGAYEEALRLLYRLPDAEKTPAATRWMADAWYNLGLQRLQAGDTRAADQHFKDSLELVPGDAAALRHREWIRRYRGHALDDNFRLYVAGLSPRTPAD